MPAQIFLDRLGLIAAADYEMVENRLFGPFKWSITRHHDMIDGLMNTHLQSFDGPTTVEEEPPSLEIPTCSSGTFKTIVPTTG